MTALYTNLKIGDVTEKATTQRTDYGFNSYTVLEDERVLATNSDGLFLLGGDTHNGDEIDSVIETATVDLGQNGHLRYIYFGIDTPEGLIITPIVNETDQPALEELVPYEADGEETLRASYRSDIRGRYWRFRIQNTNSGFISLNSINAEFIIISKGRRTS